jgi:hypothetical protein
MLGFVIAGAYRLDEWLDRRLGRPYAILLIIGLTAEIGRRVGEVSERRVDLAHTVGFAWLLVLNGALLIHQLASLHHIRQRRARARAAKAGEPASDHSLSAPAADPAEGA